MRELVAAKSILFFVAASYVLSALILGVVRLCGETVPGWVIGGWMTTGIAGMILAKMLTEHRPAIWWGLLIALGPWMVYAMIGDFRERHWIMGGVDIAGLLAIGWSLAKVWAMM